jgi:DNA-binding IclR family transcriptional regulator
VSGQDGSGVKSAERALTILELFSRRDRALSFTQVAEALGYPRSSLHGLLRTLTERGWLGYDAATRRYSLGIRAWEAGKAYGPAVDLVHGAAPVVERLGRVVDGRVHVLMLDGHETVRVLDSADDGVVRADAHTSGAGRVLLAGLDRPQRARHLPGPSAHAEELHGDLDRVHAEGWAEADGPDGLRSLAVPVRGGGGAVVAALGIAVPGFAGDRRDRALRELQQGAEQISAALRPQPAG